MTTADQAARRRVVIESPYAGEVEKNQAYARRCMRDAICRGEAPLASHLLYPHEEILDDDEPDERAIGVTCNFAWIERADAVAVYTDLGLSPGMTLAIRHARNHEVPVEVRSLDPDTPTPSLRELLYDREYPLDEMENHS